VAEIALQHAVQAVLDELVADGDEVGLQAVVMKDGALVADAHSGVADPASGEPVSAGTLFFAGSTAKGVLSSLVHALVADGRFDYELRLAEVWPEFAAHGKGNVTVRHVLMHQVGVPGLPPDLTTEQLCDWDHMCALVAEATPWWPPGTAFGYHAQTFGFLLGMVGTNGSAAYADIDTGVAIALMRNRFSPDFTAIARLDDIVAKAYPPPANPEDRTPL